MLGVNLVKAANFATAQRRTAKMMAKNPELLEKARSYQESVDICSGENLYYSYSKNPLKKIAYWFQAFKMNVDFQRGLDKHMKAFENISKKVVSADGNAETKVFE